MDPAELARTVRAELIDFGWWCYRKGMFQKGVRLPETLAALYEADEQWHAHRVRAEMDRERREENDNGRR